MKLQSTRSEQKKLSVAAYNGGFALVREMRYLKSGQMVEEVQFLDVAERVETDSIVVKGLDILEQNYDYDLVSKGKLLERYIDRNVHVRNTDTGEEMEMRLLSVAECIIGERVDTKEIVIDPAGELILPALPEGLLLKPALVWKIEPALLDQEIIVSYLTKSLEWHAHYTLELKDNEFQFYGWVKILNHSGAHYENAQLVLVAGDVHRPETVPNSGSPILYSRVQAPVESETLPDRFIYRLSRPVTVMNEQLKQLSLFAVTGTEFKRTYHVLEDDTYASVQLELPNTEKNGLGMPLPEGVVKVYEFGGSGEMFFTGEDQIDHTAAGKTVRVHIGKTLDIQSESYEKLREKHGVHEYITCVYKLENRKQDNIRIFVNHFLHGQMWEMESSSHDYERKSSSEMEFIVHIHAGAAAELEFTYKIGTRPAGRDY